jgi:SAM-dependent MidA family methyltransferase
MPERTNPSPAFRDAFVARADRSGAMRFDHFVALALYDPRCGYYAADRRRVGREPGTDFFTNTSSGPLFGELIAAACTEVLGRDPSSFTFVEIGAEPGHSILRDVSHPFRSSEARSLGASLDLTGELIVFSNELLDAQPFRRFVVRDGRWIERGVGLDGDQLTEVDWGEALEPWLPPPGPEGSQFDAPRAAAEFVASLGRSPWRGLFVAVDYGKSFRQLAEDTPAGTARAYWRHSQHNDLLDRPGEQDLTVHVCWDWIEEALVANGFSPPRLESQESFLMHQAGAAIERILRDDGGRRGSRSRALLQLLHPGNMGQAFQVMWARRGTDCPCTAREATRNLTV